MADEPIGKVTHYYDRLGVAVATLASDGLRLGDRVRLDSREGEFEQTVESMEINKEKVEEVKPGDEFALKVERPVREGDKIYKL